MNVSIIGTGLQFTRRAPIIINSKEDKLISISGNDTLKAKYYSNMYDCDYDKKWQDTIKRKDIDAVVITTPPDLHSKIAIAAIKENKHVLCEKPLSRTILESKNMHETAKKFKKILKCGFNHRHHPAMLKAKELILKNKIGKLMFGRGIYGICGRPDYKNEWRANPKIAAGGQFIEQGSHLIDLFRWYFGDVEFVSAMTSIDYFKDQSMDDGGFALLKFKNGSTASMHTSLAQWINTFCLEIYGTNGYIKIDGLGGGYGDHKLFFGQKDFNAPFAKNITYYRGSDKSWLNEWLEFKKSIKMNIEPMGSSYDGLQVMKIAKACYSSSNKKKFIKLN